MDAILQWWLCAFYQCCFLEKVLVDAAPAWHFAVLPCKCQGLLKVSTDQTLAGQFDISWLKAMLRSKLLEIQFEVAARPTKSQRSHITHGIKCRRIDSTRDYDRLKANVGKRMEAPQRMALQNCRSWVSHAEVSLISHVHKAWSLAPKQVPTWSNQFD